MRPQEKSCFVGCRACMRCEKKSSGQCPSPYSCSGHVEVQGGHSWDRYDRDDECRCSEGILKIRRKNGQLVMTRYSKNPFQAIATREHITQDERDWNQYLQNAREELDDELYDPLIFDDGTTYSSYMGDL